VNGAEEGYETVPRDRNEWVQVYGQSRALDEALKDADFWEEWAKHSARRLNAAMAELEDVRDELAESNAANHELHAALSDLVDHTDDTCPLLVDRDRYRLAWLSARRRAARESEYAAEALSRKSTCAD
jgi:biopolymer transport protein ExbB/TolQ